MKSFFATKKNELSQDAITSEATTARAAEQANATAISTEAATARAAEQANAAAITAESTVGLQCRTCRTHLARHGTGLLGAAAACHRPAPPAQSTVPSHGTQVTKTLATCAVDVLHFSVVFLAMFIAFASGPRHAFRHRVWRLTRKGGVSARIRKQPKDGPSDGS